MNTYKEKNLIELIRLSQDDDERALEEIVKRYQNKVYESFSALNPKGDLTDLTQEALTKMSKSIKLLKNPKSFNSWLQRIVHNIFYDTLKRHNTRSKSNADNPIKSLDDGEFGPCIIDERKTPDENSLACELKQKINKAIEELPPLLKTIILLREIDGLSYEEIAETTNMNINTVKTRISRARIKLKKELEQYLK